MQLNWAERKSLQTVKSMPEAQNHRAPVHRSFIWELILK